MVGRSVINVSPEVLREFINVCELSQVKITGTLAAERMLTFSVEGDVVPNAALCTIKFERKIDSNSSNTTCRWEIVNG